MPGLDDVGTGGRLADGLPSVARANTGENRMASRQTTPGLAQGTVVDASLQLNDCLEPDRGGLIHHRHRTIEDPYLEIRDVVRLRVTIWD